MRFLLYTFLIAFSLSNTLSAQDQKYTDSLKNAFNKQPDPIEKIKTAQKLFHAFKHKNKEEAFKYVNLGLELSKKNNDKIGEGLSYLSLAYHYRFLPNIDSSRFYFKKSIPTLKNNKKKQWMALNEYAIFETLQGDFDTALKLADEGLKVAIELKHGSHMVDNIQRKSTIYMDNGNFKLAMEEAIKAFKVLDTIVPENRTGKAIALGDIGRIEMLRGNYEKAIEPLKESLEIFKELKREVWVATMYMEVGNVYWYLEDYDEALNNYKESLAIGEAMKRDDYIATNLANMADIYSRKGDHMKALELLEKAQSITEKVGSINNLIINYNQIGDIAYRINDYKRAITNYTKALKLSDSIKALDVMRDSYSGRSKAYEKAGNYINALQDQREYQIVHDSIFNNITAKQIEELKTKYETEKKEAEIAMQEQEIKTLSQEVKISNLRKSLYAGGMISFIIICGLLFFSFKERIKKNRLEREKQEEIYRQEIEFKKKELASQTLHLVQKSTFIQELKENLEKIKKSPELFKVEFRRLVMLLKKESAEDKDWEVFKSYFSEVHNNFDIKLKNIFADISEKEMRLASFLRMNLSTKEIASMLNVLPDSILKSKYRLKKKLNLDKETDLNQFLNSL
ncbi:tetratricopeptide repeat protein [Flavivirga eckloniae]|uniref:Uncharacterized protein n=1 Tax=Flavivirga eckloniae TaxID=1803846 RepID=A0A2K9PX44_9FLAO|nr:tetratricopeptide repeat protein [Flavivirga eckloniae]AUP81408.1 hypothetical protein C1H87_22890 [Flavivirga eckloniae]